MSFYLDTTTVPTTTTAIKQLYPIEVYAAMEYDLYKQNCQVETFASLSGGLIETKPYVSGEACNTKPVSARGNHSLVSVELYPLSAI